MKLYELTGWDRDTEREVFVELQPPPGCCQGSKPRILAAISFRLENGKAIIISVVNKPEEI